MIYHTRVMRRPSRRGFTLMEILVVVAIILVLAGLGGYYLMGQANKARDSAAKAKIHTLEQAVKTYNLDHRGQWPPSLQVLLQRDQFGGPYLENQDALLDPWDQPFNYNQQGPNNQGIKPDIWCTSPTSNRQIGNWASAGSNPDLR
jgi:general secretion pathway protein G